MLDKNGQKYGYNWMLEEVKETFEKYVNAEERNRTLAQQRMKYGELCLKQNECRPSETENLKQAIKDRLDNMAMQRRQGLLSEEIYQAAYDKISYGLAIL